MLQIKDISKEYRTGNLVQMALDHVSLNLRDNEFVAILGPSGSGKTTLLNIIGGLDRYDSGDLIINGISTKKYKDRDWDSYRNHTIGYIFQSYNLIPHQTVLANVELALTISGISGAERRQRAQEALEKVGLKDHMHKKPNQMSGGQMQRVAIARALVNNPDIILADEPTGALDTATSVQVMELLKEVAKDRLVVMVTHNPELAHEYATRIVNLKDGVIRSDTDPFIVENAEILPAVHQNMGKSSMSLLTALSLSFNNLLTKKARTILVAFAGSIGIIGIALILSLSNGMNTYIRDTEEETLSEYPVQIQKESFSMANMMMGMRSSVQDGNSQDEETTDQVHEAPLLGSMLSTVNSNDLGSFKKFLESGTSGIDQYAKAIDYSYNFTPIIYKENGDQIRKVNPNESLGSFGFSGSTNSMMASYQNVNVFFELPEDEELYVSQYDLKAGHWPRNSRECVVVMTSRGSVSDFLLYTLGLKNVDELDDYLDRFANNEEVNVKESHDAFDYDKVLGITFKVIQNSDLYTYDTTYDIYSDRSDDEEYMKTLVANGQELIVSGIVKPKEDAKISMLQMGIYYDHRLVEEMISYAENTLIVQKQLADAGTNVFTGKPFGEDKGDFDLSKMFRVDENAMKNAFSFDTGALNIDANAFQSKMDFSNVIDANALASALPSMSKEDITKLLGTIKIEVSEENLKKSFTAIINSYLEYASKDPSTDYANLSVGIREYLNSDEGKQLISNEIMRIFNESGVGTVDSAYLTEQFKTVFLAYMQYVTDNGLPPEDYENNLQLFLAEESTQQLIMTIGQNIAMEITSKITISDDQLARFAENVANGYIAYAEENGLPDPSKLQESFTAYLQTEEGKKLIQEGIDASVNTDEVEKQLSAVFGTLTSQFEGALNSVMQSVGQNIGNQISNAMSSVMADMGSNMQNAFKINTGAFAKAFQMDFDENEMKSLISSLMRSGNTTQQSNLTKLGYADLDEPQEITIYPFDFDSKSKITEIINNYNDDMKEKGQEEKVISYTDLVGTLMSSVTSIIDTISYVLVAFVAISLVVSSIMIGVITYISVLERRKEIGILRAMGASKHNISQVFNAETFITGLLAGVFGIVLTKILLIPTNYVIHNVAGRADVNAILPPEAAGILILLSVVLTLIGGLIPAKKASKSDPVTALRTE